MLKSKILQMHVGPNQITIYSWSSASRDFPILFVYEGNSRILNQVQYGIYPTNDRDMRYNCDKTWSYYIFLFEGIMSPMKSEFKFFLL